MLHLLVIVTPVLVLGVLALLGFLGCDGIYGLHQSPGNSISAVVPASGTPAGGTTVTVLGKNFDSSCTVSFGGSPATSVSLVSDTTLTCNTPAHAAGVVDVTVSSGSSTSTLQGGFNYDNVTHLQTLLNTVGVGAAQLSVSLPDLGGGELVIAAVEWGGAGTVTLAGAGFTQLEIDDLNPQQVAIFFAPNVGGALTITATLSVPTTAEANLVVSAYGFTGGNPDRQGAAQGLGSTADLSFQTTGLSPGDLVYSVAIARKPGQLLGGTLSPGTSPGFTPESGQGSYHLVQDYILLDTDVTAGQITVSATNTSGQPTSHWYIFAMRIPHA